MNGLLVPLIIAIIYTLIEVIKTATKNEKIRSFIPVIAGVLGGTLSVVAYYFVPEFSASTNVLVALLIGIMAGLSATGSHQIIKQLQKLYPSQIIDDVVKDIEDVINTKEPTAIDSKTDPTDTTSSKDAIDEAKDSKN